MMASILRFLVLIASCSACTAFADGDARLGKKLYEECIACHSIKAGEHGVGPSLHGVFGRKAGELTDFRYSPALKRSGITWTAQTMDAFVADSQKLIKANRMAYSGMPNASDRANLLAYMLEVLQ